jgi:hypothetical protein
MARPLKNEYINSIIAHYVRGEEVKEAKLIRQVGFNKYVVEEGNKETFVAPFVMRLVSKELVEDETKREEGMGYVVVTHTKDGEKSLAKLTKNLIVCTDGSVYPFEYELDTSVEGVVKVLAKEDALTALEGFGEVVVEEEEPTDEPTNEPTVEENQIPGGNIETPEEENGEF